MKKVLVVLLALAVLLSLSSVAFAGRDLIKRPSLSGATIYSNIDKKISQKTEAKTRTGGAFADANNATNMVMTQSEAKALDCNSDASNTSAVGVANTGDALSASGPASAANDVTNADTEIITDIASATAECDFTKEACDRCGCPGHRCPKANSASNENGDHKHTCDKCEKCDCCPATVKGDINIDVKQETKAEATSGDATAYGNNAMNMVASCDKAFANNGGTATNSSSVTVINDGTATAMSGAASSTNIVNNSVGIDILRSATTSRMVSKFLQY